VLRKLVWNPGNFGLCWCGSHTVGALGVKIASSTSEQARWTYTLHFVGVKKEVPVEGEGIRCRRCHAAEPVRALAANACQMMLTIVAAHQVLASFRPQMPLG
jgi:hypothetical protein